MIIENLAHLPINKSYLIGMTNAISNIDETKEEINYLLGSSGDFDTLSDVMYRTSMSASTFWEQIKTLAAMGKSTEQIVRLFGIEVVRSNNWLKMHGYHMTRRGGKRYVRRRARYTKENSSNGR